MNRKASNLPKPQYPAAALAVKASGSVSVQVTIDEAGKVVSATAISGHPLLRTTAQEAASAATFVPTLISGKPVMVSGVITYNFTVHAIKTTGLSPSDDEAAIVTPSEEQMREIRLKQMLHAWVYAVVERLEKKTSTAANESQFVRDGRASVEITFTESVGSELLERLKALGFEVGKSKGVSVTGTIAIEKLRDLADIEEVKYAMPRTP